MQAMPRARILAESPFRTACRTSSWLGVGGVWATPEGVHSGESQRHEISQSAFHVQKMCARHVALRANDSSACAALISKNCWQQTRAGAELADRLVASVPWRRAVLPWRANSLQQPNCTSAISRNPKIVLGTSRRRRLPQVILHEQTSTATHLRQCSDDHEKRRAITDPPTSLDNLDMGQYCKHTWKRSCS